MSKFGCSSYMWCLSVNTNPSTFGKVERCSLREFYHHGTFLILTNYLSTLHFVIMCSWIACYLEIMLPFSISLIFVHC